MSTYNETLYSRDSKGKILEWNISVVDTGTLAKVIILYGEKDGKLTKKSYSVYEGKNFGKSNVTTYLEQAISEAKSKVNKKLNQGYVEPIEGMSLNEAIPEYRQDKTGDYKPMLAKKFEEGKVEYPVLAQAKLNGVRCQARFVTKTDGLFGDVTICELKSRDGHEYHVDHIEASMLYLLERYPEIKDITFDGEIYCHDMKLQDIVSATKKPNANTHRLEYWMFDIKSDRPQEERLYDLEHLFPHSSIEPTEGIMVLQSVRLNSDIEVLDYAKMMIEYGFEGGILRNPDAPYQYGKRTKYLQKVKQVEDREFLLVNIIDSGNDNYLGEPIGMFICKNDLNDLTFKVTPQASKEERYQYLKYKNQYIGKYITVTFRERTKDNIPFHANGIIRDYE